MSLWLDLLFDLLDGITDFFVHGLTLRRVLVRLFVTVLLFGGFGLMLVGTGAVRWAGLGMALLAGPIVLWDALTANRATRS